MASKKLKASDRQALVKKLVALLKKKYGSSVPKQDRPILEMLIYAACLDGTDYETAEQGLANLLGSFHDLNEIRVSSISEIEAALAPLPEPEWRALRIRDTLHHTFESNYAFDLEGLKRKTLDVAEKQLDKIPNISFFMKAFCLQHSLGAHVVPLDDRQTAVLRWLGLVEHNATPAAAGEEMKSSLRKADTPLACHLLRCVSIDPAISGEFQEAPNGQNGQEVDPAEQLEELKLLLEGKRRKKTAAKAKGAAKKTAKKKKLPAKKAAKSAGAKATKKTSKRTAKSKTSKARSS